MTTILSFLFVLGILIFVHELGHFLAARRAGIRVERFSLGLPPKIISKKIGETEYCISGLPFGGYVKIAGISDIGRDEAKGEPWEFGSKPVWMRMCVIAAGPAMNFFLAFLIVFGILYFIGESTYNTTRVGRVDPGSSAESAGIMAGDRILSIGGKVIENWHDVQNALALAKEGSLPFEVERRGASETILVELKREEDVINLGIHPFVPTKVGSVMEDSPAEKVGLVKGDIITAIDDEPVEQWADMRDKIYSRPGERITIKWSRQGEELSAEITTQAKPLYEDQNIDINEAINDALSSLKEEILLRGIKVMKNYSEELPKVGGDESELGQAFLDLVHNSLGTTPDGGELTIETSLIESGIVIKFKDTTISPLQKTTGEAGSDLSAARRIAKDHNGTITESWEGGRRALIITLRQEYGIIGITAATDRLPVGFFAAIGGGARSTFLWTVMIIKFIKGLIFGEVSTRLLGGPVLIGQLAGEAVRSGIEDLFKFIAILSVNVGLINVLPIPVLDGGHLSFLTIEAVFRKPLSPRQKEVLQQVGMAFLIFLMIYITFNDFNRIFKWFD